MSDADVTWKSCVNATMFMAHLDDMVLIREEQLASDMAALEKLRSVRERLDSALGDKPRSTKLGVLIGATITSKPERGAA